VSRRSSEWDAGAVPLPPGALRVEHCTRTFSGAGGDEIRAVDDVSLDVPSGQVVTIVGSNGAGKSTLLALIAGTSLVDEGRILIDGVDQTLQPSWRRASSVQRVRQNPADNVIGSLTIEENFALVIPDRRRFWLRRTPRGRLRELAARALAPFEMGLEERLHALAETLSGGQRQAVAVAMATVAAPAVLLLDEHVAALDPKSARLVLEATERIVRSSGTTTLMVTHDMGRALRHGDRLLMMHRGRVVLDLSGDEKGSLEPRDLIDLFERQSGDVVSDRIALA
jgi:putative ABC transport system ATP-binding protein